MNGYAVALIVGAVIFAASVVNAVIQCKSNAQEREDRRDARRRLRYEGRDL